MKAFNFIMLLIILLSNIFFFIPLTYKIFHSGGGPFGFGVMLLPFQLLAHLFIIPAVLALRKKWGTNRAFLWINGIGAVDSILWLTIVLTYIES